MRIAMRIDRLALAFSLLCVASLGALALSGCSKHGSAPPLSDGGSCSDGSCDAAPCSGASCDGSVVNCAEDTQCPAGTYCDSTQHACLVGCRVDDDCLVPPSDASVDAAMPGTSVDGGADAPDAGASTPKPWCEPQSHACVECVSDDHCDAGMVCRGYRCVTGCTDEHGCADGQTCCQGACLDLESDRRNCGACGVACPGISQCCDGLCHDVYSDSRHCGTCGVSCPGLDHASSKCSDGDCIIDRCAPGYFDCNGKASDGCEVSLQDNQKNCGMCGKACLGSVVHGNSTCAAGGCVLTCEGGFADCDDDPSDGCEANTQSDKMNCGGCGIVCAQVPNAIVGCQSGQCVITGCASGNYADCDHNYFNGCEVDLRSDEQHCGSCATKCPGAANSTPVCANRTCSTTQGCRDGFADCDSNPGNGCETNLTNDANNCGGCRMVCGSVQNGLPACVGSTCTVGSCNPGYADCDLNPANGCEANLNGSVASCGACGRSCPMSPHTTPGCFGGGCVVSACSAGWSDCDGLFSTGCEINTAMDANNCGTCGKVCPGGANAFPACAGGACGLTCATGYGNCDGNAANGCETDLLSAADHCGNCATSCVGGPHVTVGQCASGTCVLTCEAGWGDCNGKPSDGCETDLHANANCGSCGKACTGATSCLPTISGLVDGGWQLNGSAAQDGSSVVLTQDQTNKRGSVVFKKAIPVTGFDATFDIRISNNGTAADGMGFFFASDGPTALGDGAGGLGMGSLHGFGVEFDIYRNKEFLGCDNGDPDDHHIGIDSLSSTNSCGVKSLTTYSGVSNFVDGNWHTVRVVLSGGAMTVYYDGAVRISGYALPGFVSGTSYYFGFSAGTGGAGAKHEVRNAVISIPPLCVP